MLLPDDRALTERETALPGLSTLLSSGGLSSAASVQGIRTEIPDAQLIYLRYKPATSCLAGYAAHNGSEPTLFYATALRPGSGKLIKARQRRKAWWLAGGGRFVLERESIELCFFPNDDHLRVLIDFMDPSEGREYLKRLTARAWNHIEQSPGSLEARVLAYKPERRCTLLVSRDSSPIGVIKAYTAAGFESAASSAAALCKVEASGFQRVRWMNSRRHLLAFDWLEGTTLSEAILHGTAAELDPRAAGAALAKLHLTQAPSLRERARDPRRMLDSIASTLTRLSPEAATTAKLVASHAGSVLLGDDSARVVTHGDFYAKQVILRDGTASLIDLDKAALGQAASDIGNFCAHLELEVARNNLPKATAESHAESFLDGYASVRRLPSSQVRAGHAAASLLALAHHPFRRHLADWPRIISLIVNRAAEILERGRPFSISPAVTAEPSPSLLDAALSPARARAELDDRVEIDGQPARVLAVHATRLIRIKPQRRCVIEYDVTLGSTGERKTETLVGKIRWRGLDDTAYATLSELRAAGFDERATDGIGVPAPRGKVERLNMWLSRKVPGESLTRFVLSCDAKLLARRVVDTEYKLNTSGIAPSRSHTMGDELQLLTDRLRRVCRQRPAFTPRIHAVEQACRRLSADVVPEELVPIHRDFYADQLIVDRERIWMLDIDLVALGDPALDIGNFLGHITELALRTSGDPDAGSAFEDALKERAAELYGTAFVERAEVFRTLTLARHLWISTEKPDRIALTERLLELCESRLSFPSINRSFGAAL